MVPLCGGRAFVYLYVVSLPFLSDRRRPYFSLVLDAFVLLVYLAIISYVTADMLWFCRWLFRSSSYAALPRSR